MVETMATGPGSDSPGTPAYMAPEVLRGGRAGPRSDIFSLGVVLYELFAGRHPFLAANMNETLDRILNRDPDSLAEIDPDVPSGLDAVVARMLVKEPTERYQTAGDLVDAIGALRRPPDVFWTRTRFVVAASVAAVVAVTIPDTMAAFPASELAARARTAGLAAQPAASVADALDAILARAPEAPLRVLICGSLYLAGAVLRENG